MLELKIGPLKEDISNIMPFKGYIGWSFSNFTPSEIFSSMEKYKYATPIDRNHYMPKQKDTIKVLVKETSHGNYFFTIVDFKGHLTFRVLDGNTVRSSRSIFIGTKRLGKEYSIEKGFAVLPKT